MMLAIPVDEGPLTRTTPIPPGPGGVAIATIVSSVANTECKVRLLYKWFSYYILTVY